MDVLPINQIYIYIYLIFGIEHLLKMFIFNIENKSFNLSFIIFVSFKIILSFDNNLY